MTEPDDLLDRVGEALDTLSTAGQAYDGMIPSVLHRDTGEMYDDVPGRIQAQRVADRAHGGANLMYDVPLLHAMYGVSAAGEGQKYADAANEYVERFVSHCTDTATGLFPWGDHAYWHLAEDRVGNSGEYHPGGYPDADEAVHDHFRQAPPWLWERLHEVDPECVQRFADGLDYHWISGLRDAFDRHAWITKRGRKKWDPTNAGCDFPRHTGLYVLDLAVAYTYEARPATRNQLHRLLDYWWDKRTSLSWWDDVQILPTESYGRADERSPSQTRSAAISFLEAATILDDVAPDLAATARMRGDVYLHGALTAEKCAEADDTNTDGLWGGGGPYGADPPAKAGLQYAAAWRARGDERALVRAQEIGERYLAAEPPEDGIFTFEESGIDIERGNSGYTDIDNPVPLSASDAGLVVELLADLYDATGEERWRDRGLELAGTFSEVFFDDAPLPRGAAGIDWYESELGTGTLLHGLARIALLVRDEQDLIGSNYVHR